MKKKFVIIICAVLLCCIVGIMSYEPVYCPLCHIEPSDAPYLVDLHTGEIGKIRIGKGELSDDPATFVFYFVEIAGCEGYCDTASRYCQITLEEGSRVMNPFLFCRSCRAKLRELRHERYAILDFTSPDSFSAHSIQSGSFSIGQYNIEHTSSNNEAALIVHIER